MSAAHQHPSSSPSPTSPSFELSPISAPTLGAAPAQAQASSSPPRAEEPHYTLPHSPSSPSLEHQQHTLTLSERNARSRDRPYTAHGSSNPFPINAFILGPDGFGEHLGVASLGLGGHYLSASARTSFTRVDTESYYGGGGMNGNGTEPHASDGAGGGAGAGNGAASGGNGGNFSGNGGTQRGVGYPPLPPLASVSSTYGSNAEGQNATAVAAPPQAPSQMLPQPQSQAQSQTQSPEQPQSQAQNQLQLEPVPQTPQVFLTFLLVSGRRRTMSFDPETSVGRVKELVWSSWSSDWEDERPPAPAYLRILWLGKILQDEDTLSHLKFPTALSSPAQHTAVPPSSLPPITPTTPSTPNPLHSGAAVPTATIVHLSIRAFAPPPEGVDSLGKNKKRLSAALASVGVRRQSLQPPPSEPGTGEEGGGTRARSRLSMRRRSTAGVPAAGAGGPVGGTGPAIPEETEEGAGGCRCIIC
ncbi:hypothetical protein CONPUDRAFT_168293 [Coniophora puteana RWD-64-598 SS2]|uniref:Ubiquitin-like domain-containing protein n=1 Tax=Coniophora puteana (strain RWD-64-598) TaxID=741705 RepID=A0A5M3MFF0_CONPW|nr:uncharacterized protein CONPUDRAFT_168293 [Coniophora puteana RWD-64-598 SS2]EIW77345.1 hypothetical protein CONPUDRAFT_168293 [Coniophora puteana RWD-64-598 SS2]